LQLNIYVPQEKRGVLEDLNRAAKASGLPNDLVLEAKQAPAPKLGRFRLGAKPFSRDDLYGGRGVT